MPAAIAKAANALIDYDFHNRAARNFAKGTITLRSTRSAAARDLAIGAPSNVQMRHRFPKKGFIFTSIGRKPLSHKDYSIGLRCRIEKFSTLVEICTNFTSFDSYRLGHARNFVPIVLARQRIRNGVAVRLCRRNRRIISTHIIRSK